jgi:hypothetical protein
MSTVIAPTCRRVIIFSRSALANDSNIRTILCPWPSLASRYRLWCPLKWSRCSHLRPTGASTTLKHNNWPKIKWTYTRRLRTLLLRLRIKSFITLERIHRWMLITQLIILTYNIILAKRPCTSEQLSAAKASPAWPETMPPRSTTLHRSTPESWCPAKPEVAVLQRVAILINRWPLPPTWLRALIWISQRLTVSSI